jgi:FLVCR family MFS transporter
MQACVFNTWGPIAQSAKFAFCWTDADIAWTSNVMLVVGLVSVPPSYWLVARRGVRFTVVWAGAGPLALGCLLRCVSLQGDVLRWTALLCGALNGWSSIMIEATLTLLSLTWFPAGERTTATGLVIATQMAGLVPPALLFPRLVAEPAGPELPCAARDPELQAEVAGQVSAVLYGQAGVSVAVFLLLLVHFPSGPPGPPSASATSPRTSLRASLRAILSSRQRLLSGAAFACITVPMMWIAVANQNLHPLGLTQKDTGYIQAIIITAAVIMNVCNSFLSDLFTGHLKTFICSFLTLSLATSIWLALLCFRVAPFSLAAVYTASIVCMVSLRCIIGIFYELLMEVQHPVPESLASLVWGQAGRLLSVAFLGMFSLQEAGLLHGVAWMNYFLVTFTALPLGLLLLVRVSYSRTKQDRAGAGAGE